MEPSPNKRPPLAVAPQGTNNGAAGVFGSPGAHDNSPNGVRAFRDGGALSRKAASLVGKGIPWPEASASVHDTKNMVRSAGVPWQEKVTLHAHANVHTHVRCSVFLCIAHSPLPRVSAAVPQLSVLG